MITAAAHLRTAGHLARRFFTSLSRRPLSAASDLWARSFLLPGEVELWQRMSHVDRRHSITVADRFQRRVAEPSRDEMAAVLLHDVGKIESGLGTLCRVAATVAGPVTPRFRLYHDHELIGLTLLRSAGSSEVTLAMCAGRHPHAADLRAADDV